MGTLYVKSIEKEGEGVTFCAYETYGPTILEKKRGLVTDRRENERTRKGKG